MRRLIVLTVITLLVSLAGCASYATPGGPADMSVVGMSEMARKNGTDSSLLPAFDKKPLAHLPASIAVAHIQAAGYRSDTAIGWGGGRYSVITNNEVEDGIALDKLCKLDGIAQIAPINRLLLPSDLTSDLELRNAAAQLHADMLLVYTFDTTFRDHDVAGPLSVVTLGLAPDHTIKIISTASAVLLDTRNGYVYGIASATDTESNLSTSWNTDSAIDASRLKAEKEAFQKLAGELVKTWNGVSRQLAVNSGK